MGGVRSLQLLLRAPIVRGPLRGRWWLPTGGGKVWRVLGGTYEPEQTSLFTRAVAPGDAVLDLGAHLGYYTLLASRLVGGAGRVYAFEPHPENARYLRQHVRINRCRNVEVLEYAGYDRTGRVGFVYGAGTGTGRVGEPARLTVASVRLDDFVAERGLRPAVVKVDVEGSEGAVLRGAREMLRASRPIVFLSTHGLEQGDCCGKLLTDLDYRALPLGGRNGAGDLVCLPAEHPLAAEAGAEGPEVYA